MNKISLTIAVIAILLAGFVALMPKNGDTFGAAYNMNAIQGLNHFATTTGTAGAGWNAGQAPALLLSPGEYDSYARFQNVSNVTMYLLATSTPLVYEGHGSGAYTATTSLPFGDEVKLIKLGPNSTATSTFEIDSSKFISAYWYATTTTGVAQGVVNVQYQ